MIATEWTPLPRSPTVASGRGGGGPEFLTIMAKLIRHVIPIGVRAEHGPE